jgi:hypothetical protein
VYRQDVAATTVDAAIKVERDEVMVIIVDG